MDGGFVGWVAWAASGMTAIATTTTITVGLLVGSTHENNSVEILVVNERKKNEECGCDVKEKKIQGSLLVWVAVLSRILTVGAPVSIPGDVMSAPGLVAPNGFRDATEI